MNFDFISHVPDWLKAAIGVLSLLALVGWRVFNHIIKINSAVKKLREESFQELVEICDELKEENKRLRAENKELKSNQ